MNLAPSWKPFLLLCLLLPPAVASAKSINTDACAEVCANPALADKLLSPQDPRTLATAEHGYTSAWENCHPAGRPFQTCREWCAARDRGKAWLESKGTLLQIMDRQTFENLWKAWGLTARPANFAERLTDRYGLQPAPFVNPYPMPAEKTEADDPTNSEGRTLGGGSGQLPMGLLQTRDSETNLGEGRYDGNVAITCALCHGGRIGDESDVVGGQGLGSRLGIGDATFDLQVLLEDIVKAGGTPIPVPYPQNDSRGLINADTAFEFLMTVRDFDTLAVTPFMKALPAHAHPGDQDAPAWHNTGSRPRYFMDGGISGDDHRTFMANLLAHVSTNPNQDDASSPGTGAWIRKQEKDFEDIHAYIDSIEPPPFPYAVQPDLAAAGSTIFHTRNLFPPGSQPFANGSCASCHGVYDAKFATPFDPANGSFGPMPRETAALSQDDRNLLVGIAGQIVPRDFAGTDPARSNGAFTEARWLWGTLWFAYADNTAKDADPRQRQFNETMNDYVTSKTNGFYYTREWGPGRWIGVDYYGAAEPELTGYLAPALHGVWATAPYFHNGSVPTVREVLLPSERPRYWRHRLRTPGTDIDRGFDVSLDAYDFDHLGWKYDRLDCDGVPLVQCDPAKPLTPPALQSALNTLPSQVWLTNQSPPPLTQAEIEARKIYDTTRYGRGNGGHWWTQNLDQVTEIPALIEYLKTL